MAGTSGVQKRMKCEEEDDYISALPDCLIQQIISLLPSTEEAIRTGILSKRWLYQWTHVPILIFNNTGMSIENFSNFVDSALNLYNCSKINKFLVNSNDSCFGELRPKLTRWIRFATKREVKELILDCDDHYNYPLPQFLFKNALVFKLKIRHCVFLPKKGKVNWASLKALHIGQIYSTYQAIENVLSGSPVIEYLELELSSCGGFERLVIASKSLKTLIILNSHSDIEISCPNLEKLELLGRMSLTCLKLEDLPPSVCATLDFENDAGWYYSDNDKLELVKEILLQVQHVQELKLGPWFCMILSLAAVERESSLLLNSKSLTVIDPFLAATQPGIAFLLISCSLLEKLVIQLNGEKSLQFEGFVEKSMELDGSIFDCLVSHLKTVEIVGLHSTSSNDGHNDVLKFIEFLLKNARTLEKMVFLEAPGRGMIAALEVCNKLPCIQKASPHAIIKVACLPMVDLHSDPDWDKIV